MKLSINWLNDYVTCNMPPRDFSEAMTMSGSKVESWDVLYDCVQNVVVGKILEVTPHPNADKLVVCQIDVGRGEPIQIVTGADNVFVGATVPCALHNSILPNGKKIEKGKLRGVVSLGMMCSIGELGLSKDDFPGTIEDGIMIIDDERVYPGEDIRDALRLRDTVVDFEITPNRPDCLSVIGLAREVSATFDTPLRLSAPVVRGGGKDINTELTVSVENKELCRRYMAKMVRNVKIAPSPEWMRERLRACGVRPINNLVDITNFVMLEYGQPMHAFDFKYIEGGEIHVRNAHAGETIMTLDGTERSLSERMLVIADKKKPCAVAGVMGGENSGIFDDTTTVIFESACFKGSSIRTTAKALGMRTESSARFEKGLECETCETALLRACELVELLGAGEVADGMIDIKPEKYFPTKIKLDCDFINRFLGTDISHDNIVSMLLRLFFTVQDDMITVPHYRTDVASKSDIAEEIARMFGYNKIPVTTIRGKSEGSLSKNFSFERRISEVMRACGLYEIQTYSFISPKFYDMICLPESSPLRKCVVITNPLGEDTSVMRTTTLPSMMQALTANYNDRNLECALFESGMTYENLGTNKLALERKCLTLGMYGEKYDFFSVKGALEELFSVLSIENAVFTANRRNPSYHPGRCADILIDDVKIGEIGEIHPDVMKNYGLPVRAYCATVFVDVLYKNAVKEKKYRQLPKFPASVRDLALICDDSLNVGVMEQAIRKAGGKLLESVALFDVYKGDQIEQGKKSVAFSITLRAPDRTLTDTETENTVGKMLKALNAVGAKLR